MKPFNATFATCTLILSLNAGAIQLQGPGVAAATQPVPMTDIVERGGTVMQVDKGKHELVIDGVPWSVTPSTRIVFPALKKGEVQAAELRPGDQVRFRTRKNGSSDDVVEILVVGRDKRFDRK